MRKQFFWVIALLTAMMPFSANAECQREAGLLVVVHGSPSPKWNEPMADLEKSLAGIINEVTGPFLATRVVNLEFQKPMLADGVKELAAVGCKRIVCMPLFIAHSSHVVYDIPAALGFFSSQEIHETLQEENIEIAPYDVPVVMGPTLAEGDVLLHSSLQRIQEISTNPEEEAIVIFAHGDEGITGTWESLVKRTASYLCAKTGIQYADWAFVEVGQSYGTEGLSTIFHAGQHKKRVLVIGLYISMGTEGMHKRYVEKNSDPFQGESFEIVFSSRGLLPDPEIAAWLVNTAAEIEKNRFGCTIHP